MFKKGFTLIELLIVVAIIAILAAIAVPNFLEAQTRAKVSRAKADMRSLATAIETYHVDFNSYLYCNRPAFAIKVPSRPNHRPTFEKLTTPVSYLSSFEAFTDPFKSRGIWDPTWTNTSTFNANDQLAARIYFYYARNEMPGGNARWDEAERGGESKPKIWFAESAGPEGWRFHGDKLNTNGITKAELGQAIYDSTNGTVSKGAIWRTGGAAPTQPDRFFAELVQGQY